MLDSWGIRNRILLLAAISPALIAIVAGGYLINHRIQEISQTWNSLGQGLAGQLAPASEYGIARRDRALLEHLAHAALGNPEVREVIIRDSNGLVLARAGREAPSPATLPWLQAVLNRHSSSEVRPFTAAVGMANPAPSGTTPAGRLGQVELYLSASAMQAEQLQAALVGGLLLALALLASILLGLRIARGISAPVQRLATTVRTLREGDLSQRVAEHSGGELGSLERDINAMADALQTNRRELRSQVDQATGDLRTTLEELEIKHAELDLARRRAVEANRGKTGFIARMSHEIRTPVNGIVGFTRLLEQTRLSGEQEQYTRIITSSANSLLHIINDILDFSRVEADRIVLDHRPFRLRSVVEDCLGMLAPRAWEKHLQLTHMIYRDVPGQLRGDPVRLRQLLTNLVANAIKFTHDGQISVRVMMEDMDDDTVTLAISVTDTGAGIHPADRHRIFGAFTQADGSMTREFGGAGLGLYICDRLIRAMGGKIGFTSRPGQGSRFWFNIKLERAAPEIQPEEPVLAGMHVLLMAPGRLATLARQHALEDCGARVSTASDAGQLGRLSGNLALIELTATAGQEPRTRAMLGQLHARRIPTLVLVHSVDQALQQSLRDAGATLCLPAILPRAHWLVDLRSLIGEPGTPPASQTPSPGNEKPAPHSGGALAGLNILIVDDNAINRTLSALMLQRHGAQVEEAQDGHRALALDASRNYDCILMDIHMPGLGGTETAARLLANAGQGHHTPVIALTADTFASQREDLGRVGIRDCLLKPVTETTLVNSILSWCGRPVLSATEACEAGPPPRVSPDMLEDDLREQRHALETAFSSARLEAACHHVHLIHGTAAFCGLDALREAAARLEALLRDEGFASPGIDEALAQLQWQIDACLSQLHRETAVIPKQE